MNAASQTGQDPSLLKKMLPLIAMVAAGYMAKQRSGRAQMSGGSAGAQGGGLLGGLLGGSQFADTSDDDLGGLLDMGAQRNPLDEIMGSLRR
jgi:hypothetical protein